MSPEELGASSVALSVGICLEEVFEAADRDQPMRRDRRVAEEQRSAVGGQPAGDCACLCDAGIAVLADAGGISTTTTIHARAVMAGGTLKAGKSIQPISHIDFDAIGAAFPAAIAACA